MLYFIPAWYQRDSFSENEQYWYTRRLHSEFDDTVKQVQLFNRSGAYPCRIMLLSFAPNFRHFLHRQSVFHAPYWSCFDAIQEIGRKRAYILSFHNLSWPSGIEFQYSPFAINAVLDGKKYARIDFGEDGNPIQVDMFEENLLHRRNIYDDRGFVSSTIIYDKEEKPLYQDYLNEKGIWKIRVFFSDGHVKVNEKIPTYKINYEGHEETFSFTCTQYKKIDDVISEVLGKYLEFTSGEDIFCAAAHERHAGILVENFAKRKLILSFFEDRYIADSVKEAGALLNSANHFITDSELNSTRIINVSGDYKNRITDITPYDSRVSFGISQQLEVQNILVPIDGLDDLLLAELIRILDKYVATNKNARVHLFTRSADDSYIEKIRKLVADNITDGISENDEDVPETVAENEMDREDRENKEQLFFIEQCVSELAISKCVREQRIMVDVRKIPELFLQISAISNGIPMIVRYKNQYVAHEKNGYILESMEDVPKALDFYLANLNNWNEAKIYSYELGKKYTTKVLLDKWKGVIESLG